MTKHTRTHRQQKRDKTIKSAELTVFPSEGTVTETTTDESVDIDYQQIRDEREEQMKSPKTTSRHPKNEKKKQDWGETRPSDD